MKNITAQEFDEKFDNGDDLSEYLDWSKATRPNLESIALSVELPRGVVLQLDVAAQKLGLSRDALIEAWLKEKLDNSSAAAAE